MPGLSSGTKVPAATRLPRTSLDRCWAPASLLFGLLSRLLCEPVCNLIFFSRDMPNPHTRDAPGERFRLYEVCHETFVSHHVVAVPLIGHQLGIGVEVKGFDSRVKSGVLTGSVGL